MIISGHIRGCHESLAKYTVRSEEAGDIFLCVYHIKIHFHMCLCKLVTYIANVWGRIYIFLLSYALKAV